MSNTTKKGYHNIHGVNPQVRRSPVDQPRRERERARLLSCPTEGKPLMVCPAPPHVYSRPGARGEGHPDAHLRVALLEGALLCSLWCVAPPPLVLLLKSNSAQGSRPTPADGVRFSTYLCSFLSSPLSRMSRSRHADRQGGRDADDWRRLRQPAANRVSLPNAQAAPAPAREGDPDGVPDGRGVQVCPSHVSTSLQSRYGRRLPS
jgi:hypothetical protein